MIEYSRQSGEPASLAELAALVGAEARGDAAVTSVTANSRDVLPGDLFVARPGARVHGAAYVPQALEAGALAVMTDDDGAAELAAEGIDVPLLVVDDPGACAGVLASHILGDPAASMGTYAITGTNGKTTTAYMIDHALRELGRMPGLIGTVEVRLAGASVDATLTTPMPDELQSYLAFHRRAGGTDLVMEVSSHAIAQGRANPVRFSVAGFTNLTQDHLDFHKTMEEYYAAKALLFTPEHTAAGVIIVDDEWGRRLVAEAADRLESVTALAVERELPGLPDGVVGWTARVDGTDVELNSTDGRVLRTSTALPGRFNGANAALAACMLLAAGYSIEQIESVPGGMSPAVPGRMEVIASEPRVVVDFAHNTEALVKAIDALRPSTRGRLVVVTGAAGERDKGKRPAMGKAAVDGADLVYITDDDPHGEDPAVIRADVLSGTRESSTPVIEIPDRAQAIAISILDAAPEDTILLAGRGHETIQEVAGVPIELDDRVEARRAIARGLVQGEEKL